MKKIIPFLLVMLISNSMMAQENAAAGDKTAKVYLLRSDAFPPLAGSYNVFMDDELICKVSNKRYSVHNITPGSHVVSSQVFGSKAGAKVKKEKLEIEAGKTYYVRLVYKHGIFSNKLKCKEIDEAEANKLLPSLKQIKNCK